MDDDDFASFVECQQVRDMEGVTLREDGSFERESISFIIVENAVAEDGSHVTNIRPASFVPLSFGIEPNHRLFDFLDRYAAKARYGAARWDIRDLTHRVVPDDENPGELTVETTFDLIVTIGDVETAIEGCEYDSEILPLQVQFAIADGRARALAEYQREIEP
ncbi:hypothetical protein [Mycobacterium sp. shizuoka-1]|uniref:hypothetical protein n=1 Tax=Mycobacterium sp. shizuoka-1 TaxID=2039281 RepID=UPI000C062D0D|nr:hypothetical protein [Mycobacterium sp. shizuoka-1]GAY14180.1 hypothetical protein MSZK_09060 [Mycobacterium sp. shizuoka-1]